MKSIVLFGLALLATAAFGCGDDDVAPTDSGTAVDPRIVSMCTAAVASTCSMRPRTQAECESGIVAASTGACPTQWTAFFNCATATPMAVVCDAMGYTQPAGCTAEQAAYATCAGGMRDAGGAMSDAGNVPHDSGIASDAGGGGGGDGGAVDPRVVSLCMTVVASTCSMRPSTQAVCEEGLGMVVGACPTQFSAYAACATGMPLICDATGYPQVAGCTAERTAFATCSATLFDGGM